MFVHQIKFVAPYRHILFSYGPSHDRLNITSNTTALMTMINAEFPQFKLTTVGFKIVHIKVGRLPMSTLDMESLSSKSWQKISCFDSLFKAMRGHIYIVSIPSRI